MEKAWYEDGFAVCDCTQCHKDNEKMTNWLTNEWRGTGIPWAASEHHPARKLKKDDK